jgi:GNAT superfamily N-acetyltransferase
VFVNGEGAPRVGLFCAARGISFLAGDAGAGYTAELVAQIKQMPRAMLFVSIPGQEWKEAVEAHARWAFAPLARVSFTAVDERKVRRVAGRKAKGARIVRVGPELSPQALTFDDGVPMIYGSAEGFDREAVGFGAVLEGRLVSLAWTGYPPAEDVLIGVRTHPDHRGRGLAALCAARLACWCIDSGRRPHWNAHASNLASLSAGRKAGFTGEVRHWWLAG